jgi:hypothetical protein
MASDQNLKKKKTQKHLKLLQVKTVFKKNNYVKRRLTDWTWKTILNIHLKKKQVYLSEI